MKQFFLLLVTLFFALETTRSQDSLSNNTPKSSMRIFRTPAPPKYSSDYYAIKSSKFRTTGWVLLSVGAVISVSSTIAYENQLHSESSGWDGLGNALLSGAGMIVGYSLVVASIPILITSAHYKKKALNMSATLKLEPCQELHQTGISLNHYPSLGLRIQL